MKKLVLDAVQKCDGAAESSIPRQSSVKKQHHSGPEKRYPGKGKDRQLLRGCLPLRNSRCAIAVPFRLYGEDTGGADYRSSYGLPFGRENAGCCPGAG